MAEVWEGRDDVLSRPVAVKMLLPHLAADPALRERFRREAVTAARLVHPGIVAIFDAGVEVIGDSGAGPGTVLSTNWSRDERERPEIAWPEHPSTAFIVMELVPGETLKDLVARSAPLSPELAVAIALQVTDALAHAHAHGLVHRDVKPANVLLRDEGPGLVRVKVADFGIAKAATTTNDLTANGALLGTPKYIAPEQVEGKEPDARADLYSLGVVMYEMLAGSPPFKAGNDMATALAHVQQPAPDLAGERSDLPPVLTEIVSSLLVKEPSQRVGSALELAGALISARRRMGDPPLEPGGYLKLGPAAAPVRARPGAPEVGATTVTDPAAPDATRAERQEVGARRRTDRGTVGRGGSVERGPATRPPAGRPRRTGRAASVVVTALLVAGAAVALALVDAGHRGAGRNSAGQGGAGPAQQHPTATTASTVPITGVHELTLAQRGLRPHDHLSTLPDILHPGSSAVWESYIYKGPDFGGYDGLGVVLQLGRTASLHQLRVKTTMSGWTAEAFVSTSDHASLPGWGKAVSRQSGIQGSTSFSLGGRRASWVLLWMLDPGPTHQAEITSVSVS
jgi:serine/threonine-protein kinase